MQGYLPVGGKEKGSMPKYRNKDYRNMRSSLNHILLNRCSYVNTRTI